MATTTTPTTTADIIRACQEQSNLCWQMAIDTADPGTESEWQADADECDGLYDPCECGCTSDGQGKDAECDGTDCTYVEVGSVEMCESCGCPRRG